MSLLKWHLLRNPPIAGNTKIVNVRINFADFEEIFFSITFEICKKIAAKAGA